MIKVIIADDEPFIRNCLLRGIDWQGNGFQVIKLCKNGREVVESLENAQADIVITDIKMPYMDGLALLTYLREHFPKVHALVISGYEEFEYVRHAMDCSADGYLLKPVDPDALLKKMLEITEKINGERREAQRKSDPKVMLARIIGGEDIYADKYGLEDCIREMENAQYAVVCVQFPEKQAFLEAASVLAPIENPEKGAFFFRPVWRNHVYIVRGENGNSCRAMTEIIVKSARRALEVNGFRDYHMAVSNVHEGIEAIFYALEEAGRTMMLRSVVPSEKVFYSWEKYTVEYQPFREEIAAIIQAVQRQNKPQARFLLDAIFNLFKAKRCSFHDIRMFAENLLYALGEDEPVASAVHQSEMYGERLMKIYLAGNEVVLYKALDEIIDCAINGVRTAREGSVEGLIAAAKKFVRDNIEDPDLSLKKVAAHLNHNPSYFCYVFSNACGLTLTKYINSVRLERAKQLLSATEQRIIQVCEKCGYQSPNYFGRIFKADTGMTPVEYRQKCRG